MEKTPNSLYFLIKNESLLKDYSISDKKEIAYGLQFYISNNIIRIYSSKKKGVTLDLSQCKDDTLSLTLNNIYSKFIQGNLKSSSDFNEAVYPLLSPPLVGSDEVGKGDFYAPLVIGSVFLTKKEYDILALAGVKDSKLLTDKKILELEKVIKNTTNNYSILKIGQKKYNEMYEKIQNINAILAWAHSTNIKNVYKKIPFENVLVDKFGREEQIKNALKPLNLNHVIFKPKAEANIAVACASILARAELIHVINKMNKYYNFDFPLGANRIVITKGKEFVKKYGEDELKNVCKLHFKTTNQIIGK